MYTCMDHIGPRTLDRQTDRSLKSYDRIEPQTHNNQEGPQTPSLPGLSIGWRKSTKARWSTNQVGPRALSSKTKPRTINNQMGPQTPKYIRNYIALWSYP